MGIRLGANQYGKAENRVVRVYRDTPRHEIRDLNVSISLRGAFEEAHTAGNQRDVLPTDSQKNTAFAFAKDKGVRSIEEYALTLADHFVATVPAAHGARVEVEEYPWERITVDGAGHDHAFVRSGGGVRTTVVNIDGTGEDRTAHVVSGVRELVVLKSTGSEFSGFLKDPYTTLPETNDRVLATSLVARWRYESTEVDWTFRLSALSWNVSEPIGVAAPRAYRASRPNWASPPGAEPRRIVNVAKSDSSLPPPVAEPGVFVGRSRQPASSHVVKLYTSRPRVMSLA